MFLFSWRTRASILESSLQSAASPAADGTWGAASGVVTPATDTHVGLQVLVAVPGVWVGSGPSSSAVFWLLAPSCPTVTVTSCHCLLGHWWLQTTWRMCTYDGSTLTSLTVLIQLFTCSQHLVIMCFISSCVHPQNNYSSSSAQLQRSERSSSP